MEGHHAIRKKQPYTFLLHGFVNGNVPLLSNAPEEIRQKEAFPNAWIASEDVATQSLLVSPQIPHSCIQIDVALANEHWRRRCFFVIVQPRAAIGQLDDG